MPAARCDCSGIADTEARTKFKPLKEQVELANFGGVNPWDVVVVCQGYFHSSEVCRLPTRCVRCAGPHKAEKCDLPSDQAPTCTNCGGDHAAN
ncbi:hypothetical protein CEXT_38271 [Caerostris extrusa]|uniref:Uncharacterized protein n=1 Tax=Caerostris extrusa TaxID=172846 RepID=A0AAV4Y3I6_CAEEX|nr:hypothetical protein CEXT_38271 [Caerostris extrusa]